MELIKIGELAARSGVSVPTLKHYLREGLIRPARKTGRTMAWYDAALASRVRAIKRLQHDQFLPLDLIRKTIDEAGAAPDDHAAAEAIARVLEDHGGQRVRTRDELIERGVPVAELDWLERVGFAVPSGEDRQYSGDDLALLVTLGEARKAGITPEMLPFSILGEYLQALRTLVDVELRMFRAGVLTRATPERVGPLSETATRLSERLVVLLRRKLLLPMFHTLMEEARENARPARSPGTRRVRKHRTRATGGRRAGTPRRR